MSRPRTSQMQKIRRKLRERDGDLCWYCNRLMIFSSVDKSSKWRATVEHLVDAQHGGSNKLDNLVLAHGQCNSYVNGLTLEEKLAWRQRKHRSTLNRQKPWPPLLHILQQRALEERA